MSKRDVELLIRAKDEGTKVVNTFVESLRHLTDSQHDVQAASATSSTALGAFAQAIIAANNSAKGGVAGAAREVTASYQAIAGAIDQTSKRMAEQAAALAKSKGDYAALGAQIKAAESAIASMTARQKEATAAGNKEEVAKQTASLKAAEGALKGLREQYAATGASIRSQTSAIAQGEEGLSRLKGAAAAAQIATRAAGAAAGTTAPQVERLGVTARAAADGVQRTTGATTGLKAALNELYGGSRQSLSLFQRLRGEVLSLGAGFVGFYSQIQNLGGVIDAYRQLETAQNRLGVAFEQDSAAVSTEMAFLREEAQRLGIVFTDLAKSYGNITINARLAGLSTRETRDLFLSLAESGRVVGLSQDDMNAVFKAFEQIMNKGRFSAEELRGQLGERLPGAVKILAAALGVTTAELDDLMKKGEVLADRSTLGAVAERLREQFGPQLQEALQNTSTEIGRFQNNLKESQLRVAQGGFIDGLTVALRELNVWFQSDDGVRFFTSMGAALGRFAELIPGVVENLDLLVGLFQVFTAIKVSQALIKMAGDTGALKGAFAAARLEVAGLTGAMQLFAATAGPRVGAAAGMVAGALVGLRGVMITVAATARAMWVAIGGLPGLIITAITFVAGQLLGSWLTSVDKGTEALARHEEMINRIRNAYTAAGDDVEVLRRKLEEMSRVQLEINAKELQDELDKVEQKIFDISAKALANPFTGGLDETKLQVAKLVDQLGAGKISIQDFKKSIDELALADPQLDRTLIKALLESADSGITLQDALDLTGAAMRDMAGTATDADRQLLGLANAGDQVNNALDPSRVDAYSDALSDLIALAPSAADALRGFTAAAKAQEAYNRARDAAMVRIASANPVESAMGAVDLQTAERLFKAVTDDIARPQGRRGGGGGRSSRADDADQEKQSLTEAEEALNNYSRSWQEYERSVAEDIHLAELDPRERAIQTEIIRRNNEARQAGREEQQEGIYLTQHELDVLRLSEGAKWDAVNAERLRQEAMQKIADDRAKAQREVEEELGRLQQKTNLLRERMAMERERGDIAAAQRTQAEIDKTNEQLAAAIQKAIEFWKTVEGPEAENAILALQNLQLELQATADQATITSGEMKKILADHLLDAWDNFSQKIADGKNVFQALGESVLEFAATFLREIARMIAMQIIFNALQNMGIPGIPSMGGGGGGHMMSLHHLGGIVGSGGPARMGNPAWLTNARRMHGGGFAGLAPNEVPAILERNEEVLTTSDPRHAFNGGGGRGVNVKVVNTLDPGEFVSKGLNSPAGEQAILNFIRSNSGAVAGAMGG